MWHVSTDSRLLVARPILEARARKAIDGLGDPKLGEWDHRNDSFSTGRPSTYHLRRRLSAAEQLRVGPVRDIRGTPEARRRLDAAHRWLGRALPQVAELAVRECRL